MDELPKGLVSSTGQVPSTLEDETVVEIGQIVQLWKAYNANASVHEGDMGHRLEYLFWRIWSSENLYRSMDGSRLAKLFLRISEASPLSLATPQPTTTKASQEPPNARMTSNDDKSPSSNGSKSAPLPPPILKKSNTSSHGETPKTTRLLLTGIGGQSITRKPSTPPTPVPPPSRKTYFVASKSNGKNNKRRPVLMRRKSSQTSSGASTRTHSPQRISTPLTSTSPVQMSEQDSGSTTEAEETPVEEPLKSREEAKETTAKPNEFPAPFLTKLQGILGDKVAPSQNTKSTPPKWGYVTSDDFTHYNVNLLSADNYAPQPSSSSLVDKDFRTRFAERKRQEYEELASSLGAAAAADATNAAPQATTSNISEVVLPSDAVHTPTLKPGPSPDERVSSGSAGSGIPIMTPATEATMSAGRATGDLVPSPQAPISTSKGRSQLSALIQESRSKQADTQVVSIPEDALNSTEG